MSRGLLPNKTDLVIGYPASPNFHQ